MRLLSVSYLIWRIIKAETATVTWNIQFRLWQQVHVNKSAQKSTSELEEWDLVSWLLFAFCCSLGFICKTGSIVAINLLTSSMTSKSHLSVSSAQRETVFVFEKLNLNVVLNLEWGAQTKYLHFPPQMSQVLLSWQPQWHCKCAKPTECKKNTLEVHAASYVLSCSTGTQTCDPDSVSASPAHRGLSQYCNNGSCV